MHRRKTTISRIKSGGKEERRSGCYPEKWTKPKRRDTRQRKEQTKKDIGIQCQRNRRRENAPTEVARTGHRGRKGGEGEGITPPRPSPQGEGEGSGISNPPRLADTKREMPNGGKGKGIRRKGEKKERERKRRGRGRERGEGNRRNTGENRTYIGNRKQKTGNRTQGTGHREQDTGNKKSPALRENGGFFYLTFVI